MPIVVGVLGVIIVALGIALFTISPKEESAPVVADIVRTEETAPVAPDTHTTETVVPPQETTTDDESAVVVLAILTGTGKYSTPARVTHDIAVTLTLDGEMVTDVVVDFNNGDGPANDYQERFKAAYRTEVVGKKITEVSLARVGGASLTSGGFNEAVAAIKNQII